MKKRKPLLKRNNGFTLTELLVTIFIIAFVLGSIIAIFVQSIQSRTSAEKVTRANAAAQKYVEGLYSKTYPAVLAMQTDKTSYENFYLKFGLQPYGNGDAVAGSNPSYAHIIFTPSGGCYIVGPDGNYSIHLIAPYSIYINSSEKSYSINHDGVSFSGSKPIGNTFIIINAAEKPAGSITNITMGSNIKGAYYCMNGNEASVTFTGGEVTVYKQVLKADKSLVRAKIELYEKNTDKDKLTVIENMIQLKNG